jgi:hypothetical protein
MTDASICRRPSVVAFLAIVATGMLAGCARTPPVFSDDGAAIAFLGDTFAYQKPGQAEVTCRFDKNRNLAVCDNGITSELVVAGLPFHGVVLVEFDGRQFKPARRP